jgi:threonine aldolase
MAHDTSLAGAGLPPIDLRSDTVTKPTEAMYARMASAPLGDDGLDGDPTAQELEAVAAAALGKEAGLFVPSCTMANLLATLAQSQRSEQIVLEANAHMYTSERGAATFTGQFYLAIAGRDGAMDLNLLEDALQGEGLKLRTALVAMETSHNNASGAVLPLEHMQAVHAMASARGVPVHLDGARLFNAAVALGGDPRATARAIAAPFDTVSVCFSKGLGAPIGSALVGSRALIAGAHRWRKMVGGGMRQAGIVAAAALHALDHHVDRLAEDHALAARLADGLVDVPGLTVESPQSNIVFADLKSERAGGLMAHLKSRGVLATGLYRLRFVTHLDVDRDGVDRAVAAVREYLHA